ncbi:MAG TPA: putative toxin-antitoxin system toxin component, PIN family [Blastocatellia bacterium]|nr:putative toxin-antitoxin system toxin component, PIN family [Blastocatellia bacterium]
MKVVIDTNVLVSAALKDRAPEVVILFAASQPDVEWIVSPAIMAEYKDVLARKKFGLAEELLQRWYKILESLTLSVDIDIEVEFARDRNDAKFVACALASDAQFLITGDRDFTQAEKLMNTTVISVSLFKKLVCDAAP